MNAAQAQRNALSQRIEAALERATPTSAELRESCNVPSILWRASGESEYGYQENELIGLPRRIRQVAEMLEIEITEQEIAACELRG